MLCRVIEGSGATKARLIDQIYRLRYRVFGQRMGWDVESLHGREIDEFDAETTIYGAVQNQSGDLEGCFRLLPTTGPYMLKNLFPQLLHGHPAPENDRILETSRFAVLPNDMRPRSLHSLFEVTAELLTLQLTYCIEHNISTVVCATDVRFERILRRSCPGAWCKSVALYAAPGG